MAEGITMSHTCLDNPNFYCPLCGGVNVDLLTVDVSNTPEYLRYVSLLAEAERVKSERILAEAKAFNRKAEAENERLGVFKRHRLPMRTV